MSTLVDLKNSLILILLIFSVTVTSCGGKSNEDDKQGSSGGNNSGGSGNACTGTLLTNTPFASGDGSVSSPYLICTAEQLYNIGTNNAYWSLNFTLKADIDLSYYDGTSAGKTIIPIGNTGSAIAFTGVFDGENHTISNLIYPNDGGALPGSGLFGYLQGTVKNLIINNANINGINQTWSGILVAYSQNATITNIIIQNSTITGASQVGAVVGSAESSTLSYLESITTNVTATSEVGGILGYAGGTGCNMSHIKSSGTINGSTNVGGLVGIIDVGTNTLSKSSSTATVITSNSYAGGLVGTAGFPSGAGVHTISDSYFAGSVSGVQRLGGVVGAIYGTVANVYSSGTVTASSSFSGGIVGQSVSAIVQNSYSTANVTGTTNVGGAIGGGISGTYTNVYFTDDSNNAKGTQSLNDAATARSNATAGWDFSTIWLGGTGDPTLR